jgi:hypothetical protein
VERKPCSSKSYRQIRSASDAERDDRIEEQIRQRLARFEGRITDVEIHVSDINGPRGGAADLRATLEARVNGVPPVAVSDQGSTVDRAILGATKKAVGRSITSSASLPIPRGTDPSSDLVRRRAETVPTAPTIP